MYRIALADLEKWKESKHRKPLIIQGARQVGKTWLALEFGQKYYSNIAYVSFLDNVNLQQVFKGTLEPERLLAALSIESGEVINPDDTLIILDEIQECPQAFASLKHFYEQRPRLSIIAAGSLLGVALQHGVTFPVGKVEYLSLYPLSFEEYLLALGEDGLSAAVGTGDFGILDMFSEKCIDLLKTYFFVGGMPEAVNAYIENRDLGEVRRIQENLLFGYERDFAKYSSVSEAERIRSVWQSIPAQLAKENKKFAYTSIGQGARARTHSEAIGWLVDAGLLLRVPRVSKAGLPLSAYKDSKAFKLYMLDLGLLGALSKLHPSAVLTESELFTEFKGALAEQYICQQLVALGLNPYYWSAENSIGEVDFVLDNRGYVLPIEVKAGRNVRSRSLSAFCEKYRLTHALRFSLLAFKQQELITNVPLYACGRGVKL